MKRLILLSVALCMCCSLYGDEWSVKRAKAAFAFAQSAEKQTVKPDKPTSEECPDCYGTGVRGDGRTKIKCPTCNGSGKRKTGQEVPSAVSSDAAAAPESESPDPETSAADGDPDLAGLEFTADWCKKCREMEPIIAQAAIEYEKIDIETPNGKEAVQKFGIKGIPVYMITDRTLNTVLDRIDGTTTLVALRSSETKARALKRARKEFNERNLKGATVRIRVVGKERSNHGSGAVIRSTKTVTHVLTCNHVTQYDGKLFVEPSNAISGGQYQGTVIGRDAVNDLAIIEIRSPQLPFLQDVGELRTFGCVATSSAFPLGGEFAQIDVEVIQPKHIENDVVVDEGGTEVIATLGESTQGVSGGPLTIEGTIVGVSFGTVKNDGESYTIHATGPAIRKLIRETLDDRRNSAQSPWSLESMRIQSIREMIAKAYPAGVQLEFDVSPRSRARQHLVSEHGFESFQLDGLSQWELLCLHDATHRGVITNGSNRRN
jgi:thiol-disulfide isomerase/thioredoxin